jgi:hypothetical protein
VIKGELQETAELIRQHGAVGPALLVIGEVTRGGSWPVPSSGPRRSRDEMATVPQMSPPTAYPTARWSITRRPRAGRRISLMAPWPDKDSADGAFAASEDA